MIQIVFEWNLKGFLLTFTYRSTILQNFTLKKYKGNHSYIGTIIAI